MSGEDLSAILAYYRDLGIKDLYRMPSKPAPEPAPVPAATAAPEPPAKPQSAPALLDLPLPGIAPANDSLPQVLADIGDCKRCRLHSGRRSIVFGSGNPQARVVFVGEGPGEDEDIQGLPFVGRAGQLLTAMIENTAAKEGIPIKRGDVYICNVVKCRPPNNRTPEADEMETCGQFLARQLEIIRPTAVCALGGTATRALLGKKEGVTKLRGQWHKWRDLPVMVTYHPSYLLRSVNPQAKREAWEDLKKLFHAAYG